MTTLNPTLTRRACARLTTAGAEETARVATPARYTWLRIPLPVPTVTDSRMVKSVLSTTFSTDVSRVLDMAAIVAAAVIVVALLSYVCR